MSKFEDLQKLSELKQSGVLSEEEFFAEKKKILDKSDNSINQPPTLLNQAGHHNIPLRFEKQTRSAGSGDYSSVSNSATSMGMAFKGDVCPKCHSNDYVNTYTVWHGLLAIFWFPVGLIGLAFPIKKCIPCQTTYGVGLQITKIVKILAITGIVFVSLLLLIILTKIL